MAFFKVKKLNETDQIKQATVDVENIYDEIEIDDMEFNEDDPKYSDGHKDVMMIRMYFMHQESLDHGFLNKYPMCYIFSEARWDVMTNKYYSKN